MVRISLSFYEGKLGRIQSILTFWMLSEAVGILQPGFAYEERVVQPSPFYVCTCLFVNYCQLVA